MLGRGLSPRERGQSRSLKQEGGNWHSRGRDLDFKGRDETLQRRNLALSGYDLHHLAA